jgi:hypothetical protein
LVLRLHVSTYITNSTSLPEASRKRHGRFISQFCEESFVDQCKECLYSCGSNDRALCNRDNLTRQAKANLSTQMSATPLSPRSMEQSHRRSIWLLALLALCLFLVISNVNKMVANMQQPLRTASLPMISKEGHYFRQAYDTVYDAIIQETSCNTTLATNCFPRKRVNFKTFPLKSDGGLNDADRKFIEKTYYNANSVFEFGIGESTDIAAATNLPRYVGVDSSSEWVKMVRDRTPDRFRFFFADISKTGAWGYPVEEMSNQTLRTRNTTSKN